MSNTPNLPKLPNRDNSTKSQVDTLLQVANLMANVLVNPQLELQGGEPKKLDGGAHMAAATTFINACNALDVIITDKTRFSFDTQNNLEAQYFQLIKQNTIFLREQTATIKELNTPHSRFRPDLIRMSDGNWLVVLGNPKDLDNAVVGIGATPQAALDAFDGCFTGDIRPEMVEYLAAREQAVNTNTPLPEFPKATHELDNKGATAPRKPSRRRKNR